MTPIAYFKLQAKNLIRDYKTKKPVFDKAINDYLYEYTPEYFDIDRILLEYDWDEKAFSLMKSQHTIALMVGFRKWADLVKASNSELELAKLLFDNQDKIFLEDWISYIAQSEDMNNKAFDTETKIEIFKEAFVNVNGHYNPFGDYRINKQMVA